MESFEEYRKRVLGYLGDRDPLRVQAATARTLERLLVGVSRKALRTRPAAGKWCIAEIVAHLADAELAMGWRLRTMLATPGERLAWWDEAEWSMRMRYREIPVGRSLKTFRALRESNLALLRSLPDADWERCYGVHDKRGRQTLRDFVRMEAGHDLNHLRQVRSLLGREPDGGRAGSRS